MSSNTPRLRPSRLVLALLVILLRLGARGLRGAEPTESVKKVDEFVRAEMKREQVPGVAVAVIRKGEVVLAKGYGLANVEHDVPVTPDTIFQTGSIGKPFTAAALMLLVEDGKVSLDDSITKFYPNAPEGWRAITIRHLLTHTSGIPNFEDTFDLQKNYTEDELAKHSFGMKLDFPAGTRWYYSNPGYMFLGFIIGKAGGKHYVDVLQDRVFAPLGMKTARGINELDIVPHRSAGYQLIDGKLKNQDWVSPMLNTTGEGALYVSLRDMIAWDAGLRKKQVLKKESWDKIFSPATLKSGKTYPYGFGWFIDRDLGQLRHHHSGHWQGFATYISRYLKDDLTVIVLANAAHADLQTLVDGVAGVFNPRLKPSFTPLEEKDAAAAKRVRRLLKQAGEGKLVPEEFIFAIAPNAFQPLVGLEAPDRLELVEARERGDDRFFRYQAVWKKRTLVIYVALTPEDKVSFFLMKDLKKEPAE